MPTVHSRFNKLSHYNTDFRICQEFFETFFDKINLAVYEARFSLFFSLMLTYAHCSGTKNYRLKIKIASQISPKYPKREYRTEIKTEKFKSEKGSAARQKIPAAATLPLTVFA